VPLAPLPRLATALTRTMIKYYLSNYENPFCTVYAYTINSGTYSVLQVYRFDYFWIRKHLFDRRTQQ